MIINLYEEFVHRQEYENVNVYTFHVSALFTLRGISLVSRRVPK